VYCDENGKDVYVYDSFARNLKRIMKDWYYLSKKLNFKLILVNKKKDQSDGSGDYPAQINCGIRSFIFIYCVKLYGTRLPDRRDSPRAKYGRSVFFLAIE